MTEEQKKFILIASSYQKTNPFWQNEAPYLRPLQLKQLVDEGYLEKPIQFGQHILTEKGKQFVVEMDNASGT